MHYGFPTSTRVISIFSSDGEIRLVDMGKPVRNKKSRLSEDHAHKVLYKFDMFKTFKTVTRFLDITKDFVRLVFIRYFYINNECNTKRYNSSPLDNRK